MQPLTAPAAPPGYAPIRIIDVSPIRTVLSVPLRRRRLPRVRQTYRRL